jgi:hypothetical protein
VFVFLQVPSFMMKAGSISLYFTMKLIDKYW